MPSFVYRSYVRKKRFCLHKEWFPLHAPTQCWEMMGNINISLLFLSENSARQAVKADAIHYLCYLAFYFAAMQLAESVQKLDKQANVTCKLIIVIVPSCWRQVLGFVRISDNQELFQGPVRRIISLVFLGPLSIVTEIPDALLDVGLRTRRATIRTTMM